VANIYDRQQRSLRDQAQFHGAAELPRRTRAAPWTVTLHVRETWKCDDDEARSRSSFRPTACACATPELIRRGRPRPSSSDLSRPAARISALRRAATRTTVQCDAQPCPIARIPTTICARPDRATGGERRQRGVRERPTRTWPNSDNDLCTAESCNAATGSGERRTDGLSQTATTTCAPRETCAPRPERVSPGRGRVPEHRHDLCTAETCNASTVGVRRARGRCARTATAICARRNVRGLDRSVCHRNAHRCAEQRQRFMYGRNVRGLDRSVCHRNAHGVSEHRQRSMYGRNVRGRDGACFTGTRTVCPNNDNDLCTAETCVAATGGVYHRTRTVCPNNDNDLCTAETCVPRPAPV
jgi:hypothetical protein